MSKRILIQLTVPSRELPSEVLEILQMAGAGDAHEPHRELPGLFVANLADTASTTDLLEKLRRRPEVRNAEVEQFRSTL